MLDGNSFLEKIHLYAKLDTDFLMIDAIFSDETSSFINPNEPKLGESVTITIRVGKDNIDAAMVKVGDDDYRLTKTGCDSLFDYFSVTLKAEKKLSYYFVILKNGKLYYYNKRGVGRDVDQQYNFYVIPGYEVPAWSKGAVMYQIYVDRFCNGDKSNDVLTNEYTYLGKAAKRIENWEEPLSTEDICNFYGGDLKGVMDKLPYLKELGIDAIYFNPIFVSPSNHKYDTQDYDYIDPHYTVIPNDGGELLKFEKFRNRYATKYMERSTGKANLEASNEFFAKFVEEAHKYGIKIILDGVFNHCGAFHRWLDKEGFYNRNGYPEGAYKSEDSPYNTYFKWYDKNWPNNDCYDGWWGHDNHPKLNYEQSPMLYEEVMKVAQKWVSPPYNIDGWRLDVAADLGSSKEYNHQFWRSFRANVRTANPQALILAEHYGDPKDWLQGDQWDTVMNYDAFMEPITWFLTGMEKHSEGYKPELLCNAMAFEGAMRYHMSKYSISSLQSSMNELSNHDHSRFLTRTNMKAGRLHTVGSKPADMGINKNIMMEAVTFQMTWPGCPTIYYGDEVGLTGWTDPDNRRTFPWGKEDMTLLNLHKELIKIHKCDAIRLGSLIFLHFEHGVISYGRFYNNEKLIVILNNESKSKTLSIPVWRMNILSDSQIIKLISTGVNTFSMGNEAYAVSDGFITIKMGAFSSVILKAQ